MPIQTGLTQFESPIVALYPLQYPKIGVVTDNHEFYLYDVAENTKERLLRLNIPQETQMFCAFDPVHFRFAFGTGESNVLHIIDLEQKKAIRKFELDEQSPTALAFDPTGSYLICGTDQGRVLLWRTDSSVLIARLHSFPEYTTFSTIKPKVNYVSAILFEGNLVATSGYGGSIVVTDYMSQTQTQRLHAGYTKNSALLFYHERILVGNQSGAILKLDRSAKYPNQRLATALGPITHLLRVGPEPYLLAASNQRRILLINGEEMKVVNDRYIELEHAVTALSKDGNGQIYVGTEAGELFHFDLEPHHQLDSLIASREYAQAYHYAQQEPLLQKSRSYEDLESVFESKMDLARIALEHGENEKAKEMLAPFHPAKSKEIAMLTTAYTHIKRLEYLYSQQKFSPLYGLVEQYPQLRSTAIFVQTEKLWATHFARAQKLMLMGKIKECRTELQLFTTVAAKGPFIQLLLQHFDILKECSKAIHEHDYRTLKQLSHRYPIIRKLPSYIQLIDDVGELAPAITEALKNKAFEQAHVLLDELGEVIQYEEEFGRLKAFASFASNLDDAISHEHWRSAYRLLDTHPELMILPWAKELELQWYEKLKRCESYAVKGDAGSIKKEFTDVISLPKRHERIGDILRMAYQVQLKYLLYKNQDGFKTGAENYSELFGMDTELRHLLKTAQAQGQSITLQPSQYQIKQRDQWLANIPMLPNRIG